MKRMRRPRWPRITGRAWFDADAVDVDARLLAQQVGGVVRHAARDLELLDHGDRRRDLEDIGLAAECRDGRGVEERTFRLRGSCLAGGRCDRSAVAAAAAGASAGGGAGSWERTGKGKVTIDRVMAKAKAAKRLSLMRLSSTRRPAAGAVRLDARKREPFSQRARMAGAHDVRRRTPPEHPEAVTPEARRACSGVRRRAGRETIRPGAGRRGGGAGDEAGEAQSAGDESVRQLPGPADTAGGATGRGGCAAESVKAANGSSRSSSRELPVCSPVGARPLPKPTCSRSTSSQKTSAPRPETSELPCRRRATAPTPSSTAAIHCAMTSGCAMLASAKRPARRAPWKTTRPPVASVLNPPRIQRRGLYLVRAFSERSGRQDRESPEGRGASAREGW